LGRSITQRIVRNPQHEREQVMRDKIESIKKTIAQPYVATATQKVSVRLTEYYSGTHKLTIERLVQRLQKLTYDKPWPEGVSNDDAFNLAIHEAIQIVESEKF
jgi:hypothetical protein